MTRQASPPRPSSSIPTEMKLKLRKEVAKNEKENEAKKSDTALNKDKIAPGNFILVNNRTASKSPRRDLPNTPHILFLFYRPNKSKMWGKNDTENKNDDDDEADNHPCLLPQL